MNQVKKSSGIMGNILYEAHIGSFRVATCRTEKKAWEAIERANRWRKERDEMPEWEKMGIPEEDYAAFIQWKILNGRK